MNYNEAVIKQFEDEDIDENFIIREIFLGYKYRKYYHQLYITDTSLPTKLIKMYYQLGSNPVSFNQMKNSFVSKYIMNESKLEGVNDLSIHGKKGIEGFQRMYEYIHSSEIEYMFNVYTLYIKGLT